MFSCVITAKGGEMTYPIFANIFKARERDLVDRLATFYTDESDLRIAQEIYFSLWRSCLVKALCAFVDRSKSFSSNQPIAHTLASLCKEVDNAIRGNRFLCDFNGRGKPIFDYIAECRESVGKEIIKNLKTDRAFVERQNISTEQTVTQTKKKRQPKISDIPAKSCRRPRLDRSVSAV